MSNKGQNLKIDIPAKMFFRWVQTVKMVGGCAKSFTKLADIWTSCLLFTDMLIMGFVPIHNNRRIVNSQSWAELKILFTKGLRRYLHTWTSVPALLDPSHNAEN